MTSDNLLPPVYDLDTGTEIIDPVTVSILVQGHRKVASTVSERLEAIHCLVLAGAGVRVIANNLGISIDAAKQLINQAGYQIKPDPMFKRASGAEGTRNHITRLEAA